MICSAHDSLLCLLENESRGKKCQIQKHNCGRDIIQVLPALKVNIIIVHPKGVVSPKV
jgi:hypothetical protein